MRYFFLYACAALIVGAAAGVARAADDPPKAKTTIQPDDPSARAFLREAEEQSPTWNGFAGFTANIKVYYEGKTHEGKVEVGANRRVKVSLSDAESRKWAVETLTAMLANSQRKPFEERYEGIGVVFGKDDLHPLGMLVELKGDPYQTRFRIKDGEFRTTRRTTKEHEIAIHVLGIERDAEGRKKSRDFVVSYFDKETGALKKAEAIREEREILDGYPLPAVWVESDVRRDRNGTRMMTLTGHKLSSPPQEKLVSGRE